MLITCSIPIAHMYCYVLFNFNAWNASRRYVAADRSQIITDLNRICMHKVADPDRTRNGINRIHGNVVAVIFVTAAEFTRSSQKMLITIQPN